MHSERSLIIESFMLDSKNVLSSVDALHDQKSRQIEHAFQKLRDNCPNEITSSKFFECINEYLKLKDSIDADLPKEEVGHHQNHHGGEEMADSICDNMNDLEGNANALTSTVKKSNKINKTGILFKDKLDDMLHGQSIIRETEDDDENEIENDNENAEEKEISAAGVKEREDYKMKIIYFLKNLTQVKASLEDLGKVNVNDLHENCVDDVKSLKKKCF